MAGGAMMRKSSQLLLGFVLLMPAGVLLLGIPSRAQDPELAFEQVVGHPRGLPHLPPEGAWGEVINVTSRWIVIQNHSGQQYPISIDDIGEFLVRWPISLDSLGPQSVVEAVGRDAGSNTVEASHVDVFEGADRNLVQPTYNSLLNNNAVVTAVDPGFTRLMNGWDYAGQAQLYGWAYPTGMGGNIAPIRLHVVGTVIQRVPLQVSLPGNNFATVVPGDNIQFSMSQVTRGSSNVARKGDYAFLIPRQINPKGLVLAQLVLYKTLLYRQFQIAPK
jgi:hypothetical protein